MNGKGSRPRNVGPEFKKNFQEIDWKHDDDTVKDTPLFERTSTKKIYRYGYSGAPEEIQFVPIPCPSPSRSSCQWYKDLAG